LLPHFLQQFGQEPKCPRDQYSLKQQELALADSYFVIGMKRSYETFVSVSGIEGLQKIEVPDKKTFERDLRNKDVWPS
jgi:hypothetical protein